MGLCSSKTWFIALLSASDLKLEFKDDDEKKIYREFRQLSFKLIFINLYRSVCVTCGVRRAACTWMYVCVLCPLLPFDSFIILIRNRKQKMCAAGMWNECGGRGKWVRARDNNENEKLPYLPFQSKTTAITTIWARTIFSVKSKYYFRYAVSLSLGSWVLVYVCDARHRLFAFFIQILTQIQRNQKRPKESLRWIHGIPTVWLWFVDRKMVRHARTNGRSVGL